MRLRRAFCLLALVLAGCEARDGRTDASVNLDSGVEDSVPVDPGNRVPDSDPAANDEAAESRNVSNATNAAQGPAAVACGQGRTWTETYPCAGPCIQSFGQASCMPTMSTCSRTVSVAPAPCPATPVVPAAARAARPAAPAAEPLPNTQ